MTRSTSARIAGFTFLTYIAATIGTVLGSCPGSTAMGNPAKRSSTNIQVWIETVTYLRRSLIALLVLTLAACSSPGQILTTPFAPAPPAPPGYALVYFYRLHHDVGSMVWPDIYIEQRKVAGLADLGYTWAYLKPAHYVVRQENAQSYGGQWGKPVTLDFSEAKTYYVRLYTGATKTMELAMGKYPTPSYRDFYANLNFVPSEQALPELEGCRFIKPFVSKID